MASSEPPEFPSWSDIAARLRASAGILAGLVALGFVTLFAFGSYFQVEAGEQAVVLRLGVPTGSIFGPGLHFKIPFADSVYIADVKKVHQLEFGFRTTKPGVQSEFDESSFDDESLMLTGDLSLVHVQWTVFYRVADPERYFFQVRDVEETIRDLSEAVTRLLVGDRSNDEVMTEHRAEIAQRAREHLQDQLDRCDSGIHVERVALRQVDPPLDAQAAFNKVNEARARQQQLVEHAKRARVEALEAVKGERDGIVAEARGRRVQVVESARGEALRFLKLLAEYQEAPAVTRQWLYYDAVQAALAKGEHTTIVSASAGDVLKLLSLERGSTRPTVTPATPSASPTGEPAVERPGEPTEAPRPPSEPRGQR